MITWVQGRSAVGSPMKSIRYLLVALAVVAATFLGSATATATTFDDVGAAPAAAAVRRHRRGGQYLVDGPGGDPWGAGHRRNADLRGGPAGGGADGSGGNPTTVLDRLRNATGRPGTYAILIGTSDGIRLRGPFHSGNRRRPGQPGVRGQPREPRWDHFGLRRFGRIVGRGGRTGTSSPDVERRGGGVWPIVALLAVAVAVGGGTFWLIRRRRRKRAAAHRAAQTDAVRRTPRRGHHGLR